MNRELRRKFFEVLPAHLFVIGYLVGQYLFHQYFYADIAGIAFEEVDITHYGIVNHVQFEIAVAEGHFRVLKVDGVTEKTADSQFSTDIVIVLRSEDLHFTMIETDEQTEYLKCL